MAELVVGGGGGGGGGDVVGGGDSALGGGTTTSTLVAALAVLRTPAVAGLPITIRLPAGEYAFGGDLVFDNGTLASSITIVGAPDGGTFMQPPAAVHPPPVPTGRRLTSSGGDGTPPPASNPWALLELRPGAPSVTLMHMHLASRLVVMASSLQLHNVTLDGSGLAPSARGVSISAGKLTLNRTIVRGFGGGGLAVAAGDVHVLDSEISHNGNTPTATLGGILIGDATSGGAAEVVVDASVIQHNGHARESCDDLNCVRGGALKVVGGRVLLRGGTLLVHNRAFEGNTLYVDTGLVADMGQAVRYELPTPKGHYVVITDRGALAPATMAIIDDRYPFACAPGRYGNAADEERGPQSSPRCSGACPPGHQCALGTVVPKLCANGTYCPSSSASATDCPAGTYGAAPGLHAKSQCTICRAGYSCAAGGAVEVPCPTGSYAATNRSTQCDVCGSGTYQDLPGQTLCKTCPAGAFCGAGATTPVDCAAGTYSRATGLSAPDQCSDCPRGHYCPVGTKAPWQCPEGRQGDSLGLKALADCVPCTVPAHSAAGSERCDQCLATYYLVPDAPPTASPTEQCQACPVGTMCHFNATDVHRTIRHFTLATIQLEPSYWRLSPRATSVTKCAEAPWGHSPCIGGDEAGSDGVGYCRADHYGPLCQLCRNESRYFEADTAACEECPKANELWGLASIGVGALGAATGLWMLYKTQPRSCRPVWVLVRRLAIKVRALSLVPKLKLLIALYQSVTSIPTVYDVRLPPSYYEWMKYVTIVDINWDGLFVPGACLPGGFHSRLLLRALAPFGLMAVGAVARLLYGCGRDVLVRGQSLTRMLVHLSDVLPFVLFMMFCFCGSVSKGIFAAWSCLEFDDGRANATTRLFLRADLAVECDDAISPEYARIETTASFFVAVWPIGVPLLFLVMLLPIRRDLLLKRSTRFVRQSAFLHREYKPSYFFWEAIFLTQRLAIIGFVEYFDRNFMRLQVGLLLTLAYTIALLFVSPYKRRDVGILAVGVQVALLGVFFGALNIKLYDDLTRLQTLGGGGAVTAGFARSVTGFASAEQAAVAIFGFNMLGLVIFFCMIAYSVATQRDVPLIRLVDGNATPDLSLDENKRFHIFLSHVWSSGQDQVATIKRQLQLLLPGINCFLDVDDLEDIGRLEAYVAESQCVLIFLSKGYFFSRNCLRELDQTLALRLPKVLVHEADLSHGGAPLETICAEASSRGRMAVFEQPANGRGGSGRRNSGGGGGSAGGEGEPVIEMAPVLTWMRIAEFQLVVLRQIAAKLLHCAPAYSKPEWPPEIYVPGDSSSLHFAFEVPTRLFVSASNPGAAEMALELHEAWRTRWNGGGTLEVLGAPDEQPSEGGASTRRSFKSVFGSGKARFSGKHGGSNRGTASSDCARWVAEDGEENDDEEHPSERSPRMSPRILTPSSARHTGVPPEASHFVLYLNRHTFVGRAGQRLAQEVRRVREAGSPPIVLLHEVDPARGGCAFEHFFHSTPEDLISDGLYKKIAIACQPEPLRAVSHALIARAVGGAPSESRLQRLTAGPARALYRNVRNSLRSSSVVEGCGRAPPRSLSQTAGGISMTTVDVTTTTSDTRAHAPPGLHAAPSDPTLDADEDGDAHGATGMHVPPMSAPRYRTRTGDCRRIDSSPPTVDMSRRARSAGGTPNGKGAGSDRLGDRLGGNNKFPLPPIPRSADKQSLLEEEEEEERDLNI